MTENNEFGPLWQLTENAKSKRTVANSLRKDADTLVYKACALEKEAIEYEKAIEILRANKC